jgi:uncharacterized integral membrane protein (TIGR00698 family)
MQIAFVLVALLCLTPYVSASMALLMGLAFSLVLGNPFAAQTKPWTSKLLQMSVVGLGAGMNLMVIAEVGAGGILYTAVGIMLTLVLGLALGKILATQESTSVLVSVGTAICGGSAIAAVAPVIRAKPEAVSVALATVFLLNAAALFIFPPIGHMLGLTELQFGMWSALAIHDTSSVVGAASQYGAHALEVATTVKLARALWIIPVSLVVGVLWARRADTEVAGKAAKPWFILGFVAAAALATWVPALTAPGALVAQAARHTLVLTLFLIGAGVSRATMQSVGLRPFLQGLSLWVVVASATLGAILMGWVA